MATGRVERRLAAILAADVAGYSRLIGADESGTLEAFKKIQAELFEPTIAAHNGRLVKTTGDGFLVEFSSVVDALRCATEFQARMAERNAAASTDRCIEFRLGINVSDVVVEGGELFGDGVNVAVRLEGLADPGGICVSARVQEDATGKLDVVFEDIGEQELKNIVRPVRVFRVRPGLGPGGGDPPTLPRTTRQALGCGTAVHQYERRSRAGVLCGRHRRGRHHCAVMLSFAVRHRPQLFFTYKGRAVDVKEVGRELGVRYVLEGSVRRAGNRIRVTELVEAETSRHVWAERYDRDLADIFAVQDESQKQ